LSQLLARCLQMGFIPHKLPLPGVMDDLHLVRRYTLGFPWGVACFRPGSARVNILGISHAVAPAAV